MDHLVAILVILTGAKMAVVRYTATGGVDSSFGTSGIVMGLAPSGTTAFAEGVVVHNSGTIVVAGGAHSGTGYALTLAGLNSTGQLDPTFGSSGLAMSSTMTRANAIALGANGDFLAAGLTPANNTGHFDLAVAAFLPGGAPDTTFGAGGTTTAPVAGANGDAYALALQNDGKIVAAGFAGSNNFGLVRFLPPDTKIGSFTGSSTGGNVTLTASNIMNSDPASTISQVYFYVQNPDSSLTLVGTGSNNSGIWTLSFSETTYGLTSGSTYTFVARAVDGNGIFSDPLAISLQVV